MTEWITEKEVIKYYKLENVDHCNSCHTDMEYGYPAIEIELPDGKVAEVCCALAEQIKKIRGQLE